MHYLRSNLIIHIHIIHTLFYRRIIGKETLILRLSYNTPVLLYTNWFEIKCCSDVFKSGNIYCVLLIYIYAADTIIQSILHRIQDTHFLLSLRIEPLTLIVDSEHALLFGLQEIVSCFNRSNCNWSIILDLTFNHRYLTKCFYHQILHFDKLFYLNIHKYYSDKTFFYIPCMLLLSSSTNFMIQHILIYVRSGHENMQQS